MKQGSGKVLLDIEDAEAIYSYLVTMHQAMKESGTTPTQRQPLTREIVVLKVAILQANES